MEEVGVEAVVKGLQAFLGDMGKVNGALNGLRPSATLLQVAFEAVGSAIGSFGASVARVVETALGVMLRDVIEGLIRAFGDLVQAIFETGAEFQTLKIRLTGLNLNDFVDGVRSFDEALGLARDKTIEEITWLQTLGAQTPFDPAQIADTYTQARAFGFAADEAKRLTEDIINYTAGMGLSNETLFLVIQNMGQMVQRGKITGTEIRDLARGSFLPLADVLERIAKNMGMTVKELTQKISTPEGIPAQEFVKAFEQMVEEEPRFVGAAGRMSRALLPAAMNVKELITSVFGLNTVSPIFDILGEKIAGLVDTFVSFNEQGDLVKTQKWDDLVTAATNLGIALGNVITELLGFLPTSASLADTLIAAIQGLALWIGENRENIVAFFVGVGDAVNTWIIIPFQRITAWVTENWPLITGFFAAVGTIISDVFGQLLGGKFASGDFLGGLLDALKVFMQYVIDNKAQIADWIVKIIQVVAVVQVLLTIFNIAIGILLLFVGAIVSVIGAIVSVVLFIATWGQAVFAAIGFLSALVLQVLVVPVALQAMYIAIQVLITNGLQQFRNLWNGIRSLDWGGLGRGIIQGIASGISSSVGLVVNAAINAARAAYNAALAALGIHSPSTLFMEVGAMSMEGFAQGIDKYASVAAKSMGTAMSRVAAPAIAMPAIIQSVITGGSGSTVSNTDTRNFNLTVNSGANTEPIISDFNMLSSMAG